MDKRVSVSPIFLMSRLLAAEVMSTLLAVVFLPGSCMIFPMAPSNSQALIVFLQMRPLLSLIGVSLFGEAGELCEMSLSLFFSSLILHNITDAWSDSKPLIVLLQVIVCFSKWGAAV